MLEKQGHSVTVAQNGIEAVSAFRRRGERSFDIVLMDVQIPEMDGIEATALIRAEEKESGGHPPIIALTAIVMKGDREKCLQAGMDGYVAKPLRADELFSVREMLRPTRPASYGGGSGDQRLDVIDRSRLWCGSTGT